MNNLAIIQCNGQYRVQKKKAFVFSIFLVKASHKCEKIIIEKFVFKYCEKWISLQPGMIYARGEQLSVISTRKTNIMNNPWDIKLKLVLQYKNRLTSFNIKDHRL